MKVPRISALRGRFAARKRYSTFEDMPDGLLVFFGAPSWLQTALLSKLLVPAGGSALDAFQDAGPWHWQALAVGLLLAVYGGAFFCFAGIAARSTKLLHDRWFK